METYKKKQELKREKIINDKIQKLKKKFPEKYRSLSLDNFIDSNYYIDKREALSFCSLKSPVIIESLTESEIAFRSEDKLLPGNFRIDFPLPMSVHLIPVKRDKFYINIGGLRLYRGLIHSVTENDKKELRKYINEVFLNPVKKDDDDGHHKFVEE